MNREPGKPGGLTMPQGVRDIALRKVRDLMLEGMNARQILPHLAEAGYTESARTVYDWMDEVRRQMAEEDIEARDFRRHLRRAQLEARYSIILADVAEARALPPSPAKHMAISMLHRSAAQLETIMIKLDGLDLPIKVEHSGTVDIRALSPDQRRERIESLLAKRAAAVTKQLTGGN